MGPEHKVQEKYKSFICQGLEFSDWSGIAIKAQGNVKLFTLDGKHVGRPILWSNDRQFLNIWCWQLGNKRILDKRLLATLSWQGHLDLEILNALLLISCNLCGWWKLRIYNLNFSWNSSYSLGQFPMKSNPIGCSYSPPAKPVINIMLGLHQMSSKCCSLYFDKFSILAPTCTLM
jgi:hypothetical protein